MIVIFNLIGGGSNVASKFPEFTYTGTYELIDDGIAADGKTQNWRIKFLTSGVFTPTKIVDRIDVFCVGGGDAGTEWYSSERASGGGSGYTTTSLNRIITKNMPITITIGAGGNPGGVSGGTTSVACNMWTDSASGGVGRNGGSGGSAYGGNYVPGSNGASSQSGGTGQGTTTREFGETTGKQYAGGGGAFGNGVGRYGVDGGGNGGWKTTNATNGQENTGSGGGGSDWGYEASDLGHAGKGGSGIVVIRNARTA